MAGWGWLRRPFPNPGLTRWAWRASGAAGWAKSTTVKSRALWATARARALPWWPCGCPCPKRGPQTRRVWTTLACPKPAEALVRDPSWRWTCGRQTALPAEAWTTIDVPHVAKGPRVVDIVKRRVVARTPQRQEGPEETRVVRR